MSDCSFDVQVLDFFANGAVQDDRVLKKIDILVSSLNFSNILERILAHFNGYALKQQVKCQRNGKKSFIEPQPGELVDCVLQVCLNSSDSAVAQSRLLEISSFLLKWYSDGEIFAKTDQLSSEVTSYLMNLFSEFSYDSSKRNLEYLITLFLQGITDLVCEKENLKPKLFDLLSLVLEKFCSLLINTSDVSANKSANSCLNNIINQFVNSEWPPGNSLALANVFKDIALPSKLLESVFSRFMRQLPNCDNHDCPILTFHILLMAKRLDSSSKRKEALLAIIGFFKELENQPSSQKTQSYILESTTLMHMSLAILQDNIIGSDFFSLCKSFKRGRLTPFTLSLCFIVMKSKRFHEPLLLHLKREIESLLNLKSQVQKLGWLNDNIPFDVPDIFCTFDSLLVRSTYNWEILDSLIDLCASLLDSVQCHASPWLLAASSEQKSNNHIPGISLPNSVSIVLQKSLAVCSDPLFVLASKTLKNLFETHEMIRETILNCILSRVSSRAGSLICFIEFFKLLVPYADALGAHVSILGQLLDQVQHLPSHLAFLLLQSLVQISAWNLSFRDSLMLFLRKGSANKRLETRELSVRGVALLLGVSQAEKLPDLFVCEIISLARRCLTLSGSLRLLFYRDVSNVILEYPSLVPLLSELFSTHLTLFITNSCEIIFENCFTASFDIKEPLQLLIYLCSILIQLGADDSYKKNMLNVLTSASNRILDFNLESLGVLTDAEFGVSTDLNCANYTRALLVISTIESLIEFLYSNGIKSNETYNLINKLDCKQHELYLVVQNGYVDSKGKRACLAPTVLDDFCILSINTLCGICIEPPREHMMFRRINLALNELCSISYESAVAIGKILFRALSETSISQVSNIEKKEKAKTAVFYATDALSKLLLHVQSQQWSKKFILDVFEVEISPGNGLLKLFSDLVKYGYIKESVLLLKPIAENDLGYDLKSRILEMIRSDGKNVNEPILARGILELLLRKTTETEDFNIFVLVAKNILSEWGKLTIANGTDETEDDEELFNLSEGESLEFLMAHSKNQTTSVQVLCEILNEKLLEIEFCFEEIKAQYSGKDDETPKNSLDFEEIACKRICALLDVVYILSKTIMQSDVMENFLRTLTLSFKVLNALLQTKELTTLLFIEEQFVLLVKAGSKLHSAVAYCQLEMDNSLVRSLRMESRGKKYLTTAAKVQKISKVHAKLMADLVSESEQFDVLVITLAKKHKQLSKYIKRSAVRDFRFESSRIFTGEYNGEADQDDKEKIKVSRKRTREPSKKKRSKKIE